MKYTYRAYLVKKNMIVYVDSIDLERKLMYYGPPRDEGIYSASFSDAILMKNTGLKDLSGKDVYQGDIIANLDYKMNDLAREMVVQCFKDSIFLTKDEMELKYDSMDCVTNDHEVIKRIVKHSRVIGNVYFNKSMDIERVKGD